MFEDIYSGSTLLSPLSKYTGFRLDQLNFILCQLLALLISPLMRIYLHPDTASVTARHAFSCITGLLMVYFCFGSEIWYVVALSMLCYVIIKVNPKYSERIVFAVSMVYLAARHIQRMVYSYGSYTLDITGPLMIMVQKISGLAFSIHDSKINQDDLPPYRKKHIVRNVPGFLEFFGYLFQYQCVLAGPNVFYIDYLEFITGDNFKKNSSKKKDIAESIEPSTSQVVLWKVISSFGCIAVYITLIPYFPIKNLKSQSFLNESLFYKMFYLLMCTTLTRFMYYHAWTLADAICNASGFGFSGYDENGKSRWDLTSNVDIIGFEFGENMRASINRWNMGTNIWLRFIVYERVKKNNTLLTFLLSAFWHGFYPGYYITFITGSLFVVAARIIRKHVRPFFVKNSLVKLLYDLLTIVTTRLALAYLTFAFIMLEFWPSYYVLQSMYFFLHIGAVLAIFALPSIIIMPRSSLTNGSSKR